MALTGAQPYNASKATDPTAAATDLAVLVFQNQETPLTSLAAIYELAQIIGSIAVVMSLVFVGIELRRNTRVTRASSHHAVTASLNELNMFWASNAEITRIWLAGLTDRSALPPEERWRFDSILRSYVHVCETMFIQATLGIGDKSIVMAEENGIREIFKSRSVRDWWQDNPFGFSTDFRAYIDTLVAESGGR